MKGSPGFGMILGAAAMQLLLRPYQFPKCPMEPLPPGGAVIADYAAAHGCSLKTWLPARAIWIPCKNSQFQV